MKPNDFSYFIERYNAGEMSLAEDLWFQKELAGNIKLQDEVNLRKQTDEILGNQDIMSLRNKLAGIEKKRAANVPANIHKKPVSMKYAAIIIVLVVVGGIALLSGRKMSSSEIMKRYYSVYEPTANQRSVQAVTDDDFTQALEYYKTHDFKNAALYFTKVVESQPKDMYATLLNGISYFEDSQYTDAKNSFGKVIDDNKNLYIDQAQWYLAMCYINTNEKDKALQMLNVIKNEGGFYARDARKIIRKFK
jgi:tetratricopeptide (TPR) repeat protein